MPPDSSPGQSAFRYLESSRRPSGPERRLLSWLAAAVGQELVDQAADASVVGECTCGCSSLRLSTPAAPLPVETTRRLSDTGRADYFAVSSSGRGPDGDVNVVLHEERLEAENVMEIFSQYDLIVDGTDNFATRYLVNDACVLLDKPYVLLHAVDGRLYELEIFAGEGVAVDPASVTALTRPEVG